MSNFRPESLYNLSMDRLCRSMNEELMIDILKYYPPTMIIQIIWKVLHLPDKNPHFDQVNFLKENLKISYERGREIYDMLIGKEPYNRPSDVSQFEFFETVGEIQQTKFVDELNFCNHFDLPLFFKLVEIAEVRHKLFIIFQICIQVRGFEFPKQIVEEWTKGENQDNVYCYIEQGLKLGIFLGDAGWFSESASVLSNTYNIMFRKWVCNDKHLKLIKIIQCLTKWLSVASTCHNQIEAKIVFQRLLHYISVFENMNERLSCISYAYVVVSQYYYVLMDFNEAWSWMVKGVDTLQEESTENNKMFCIGQAMKLCSAHDKLDVEIRLKKQLTNTFDTKLYTVDLSLHNYVEILLDEDNIEMIRIAHSDCILSYFSALDIKRNLFGYYNLQTAIIFIEYAINRKLQIDEKDALCYVNHGIFIMKKIGLQDDNMLLIKAEHFNALLLEKKALKMIKESGRRYYSELDVHQTIKNEINQIFNQIEALHLKALNGFKKEVGENSTLCAVVILNLGKLYIHQKKYKESIKMFLKAIEIHESIEGKDGPMGRETLFFLALVYLVKKEYQQAEVLFVKTKKIYETSVAEFSPFYNITLKMLKIVYSQLNDIDNYNNILQGLIMFDERYNAWVENIQQIVVEDDINCTKETFSKEKLKCILNGCICKK